MELYFWLILGAILLVSLTILLARPDRTVSYDSEGHLLEGIGSESASQSDSNRKPSNNNQRTEEEEIIEEKDPEVIIAEAKKQWALGFAAFGLVFVMMGGIVLFIFDFDFTNFLGLSMVYVGIMALLKGISFQIPEERVVINGLMPVVTFFLNYLLLYGLLGVIGQAAWMMLSLERQVGDFTLVYILPYLMWKIVPTFGVEKEPESQSLTSSNIVDSIFLANVKFVIFTFSLFLFVDTINAPVLRQYAKVGFNVGIELLAVVLVINVLVSLIRTRRDIGKTLEEKAARRSSVKASSLESVQGVEIYSKDERQTRAKEIIKEQNKEK